MQNWNWHLWYQTLSAALRDGNPPLYVQLGVATAFFVVLQAYFLWRRKFRNGLSPSPQLLTTAWIGVLILLSLGVLEKVQFFYREYLRTIYYNFMT